MPTAKEMAEGVIASVKALIQSVKTDLGARIDALQEEVKAIPAPERIDVAEVAKAAAALIPIPKDGRPGIDVNFDDVVDLVESAAQKVAKEMPQPKDGLPGKDADPVDREALMADILKQIRQPEDGKSVTLEDLLPVLAKMQGEWALDFERRAQDLFQKAVDKIPKPKDGLDALGFDDLSVEHDGEREITIKFSRGEQVKEFSFTLPVAIDRGVFKEGEAYAKSDGVTFGGSFFFAQKDGPVGKPGESADWRLAVKRGRDGKNYEPREPSTGSVKL